MSRGSTSALLLAAAMFFMQAYQFYKTDTFKLKLRPFICEDVQPYGPPPPLPELLNFTLVDCWTAHSHQGYVMGEASPIGAVVPHRVLAFHTKSNTYTVRSHDGTELDPSEGAGPLSLGRSLYVGGRILMGGKTGGTCFLVTACSDAATERAMASHLQSTFALLKPDVMARFPEVISYIESNLPSARIANLQLVYLGEARATKLWQEHSDRPFFPTLLKYINRSPVVLIHLEGEDMVSGWRSFLGPTDSVLARSMAPDSLRAHFGTNKQENAAHGSESVKAAKRELDMFFPHRAPRLVPSLSSSQTHEEGSLIVMPHIIREGRLGELLAALPGIARMEMVSLGVLDAKRYAADNTQLQLELTHGDAVMVKLALSDAEIKDLVEDVRRNFATDEARCAVLLPSP